MLSIDIGVHNLGYALLTDNSLSFDIFDIDKHCKKKDIVLERTKVLRDFINDLFKNNCIERIIIERQVQVNTVAMNLMYSIVSAVINQCENVIIFDPKLKFTTLGLNYDTRNKAHKKLSINIVSNYLKNNYPDLLSKFNSYNKQDDLSDAILMALIDKYKNDKDKLSEIRDFLN